MRARKVSLPYDPRPELMLTRVNLMRFGVPSRILDKEIPVEDY